MLPHHGGHPVKRRAQHADGERVHCLRRFALPCDRYTATPHDDALDQTGLRAGPVLPSDQGGAPDGPGFMPVRAAAAPEGWPWSEASARPVSQLSPPYQFCYPQGRYGTARRWLSRLCDWRLVGLAGPLAAPSVRLLFPGRRDRGEGSAELVDLAGRRAGFERVDVAHDDATVAGGQVEDVMRVPDSPPARGHASAGHLTTFHTAWTPDPAVRGTALTLVSPGPEMDYPLIRYVDASHYAAGDER